MEIHPKFAIEKTTEERRFKRYFREVLQGK